MQILETQRLKLVPFTLELKRAALQDRAILARKLGVQAPVGWPGPDIAEALPFFIKLMEQDPTGAVWDGIIIHKADQKIIGDMGFKGGPDETGSVEIGYSIVPAYRNQGYATEMARTVIAWAFRQPEIKLIRAECLDDNIGSIKVLTKLGMHNAGHEGNLLKWELRREDWRS